MALNQTLARNIENLARRLVNATSGANGRPNFIRLKTEVNKLVTAAKGVAKLNVPPPVNVRRQVQRPSNFALYQERRAKAEAAYMTAYAASPEGKAAAAQEAANRARLNATKQKLKELDDALLALVKKVGDGVTANNKSNLQALRTQLNTMRRNAPSTKVAMNAINGKNLQFAVINRYLNNENKAIYDAVKKLVEAVAALRGKNWFGAQALSNNKSRLSRNAPANYKNLVNAWYQKLSPRHPVGVLNR